MPDFLGHVVAGGRRNLVAGGPQVSVPTSTPYWQVCPVGILALEGVHRAVSKKNIVIVEREITERRKKLSFCFLNKRPCNFILYLAWQIMEAILYAVLCWGQRSLAPNSMISDIMLEA